MNYREATKLEEEVKNVFSKLPRMVGVEVEVYLRRDFLASGNVHVAARFSTTVFREKDPWRQREYRISRQMIVDPLRPDCAFAAYAELAADMLVRIAEYKFVVTR